MEQLVFAADMFRIPRREGKKRASLLLELFSLTGKANELAAHLSGGMQRRLSIAIAMIHDPQIYILDEPAAGLDPQSRVLVRDRIRALSREEHKTIIVSTHDMEEADRMADRVAIIDNGKLLALNTPSELKHRHGTSSLIEIDLKGVEPERLDQALAAIDELNPNARLSDEIIVIDVDEGQELMRPIRTVLGRLAIEPREIRFRRRSLEDVFIEITGRRLRE
jgi:ABC-2 type transport system ATP-binding protein